MKIAVTGGLGFLGRHIISALAESGHDVTVFARKEDALPQGVSFVYADLMIPGGWQSILSENDAVINLVGVNLFQRWNSSIKKAIYESRIVSAANIVDSFEKGNSGGKVLVNASAVGIYGMRGDEIITETAPPGADFLAEVCKDWEAAALKGKSKNLRVVLLRFGSVFGRDGGAFPELRRIYRMMLGGKLGNGRQWFPWIHIDDAVAIALKAVTDIKMSGPYNCTAPEVLTNGDFTKIMAKAVKRPVLIPFVPKFVLGIVLGEFGSFLTGGQRAVPERLLSDGHRFMFPEIKGALDDLLRSGE